MIDSNSFSLVGHFDELEQNKSLKKCEVLRTFITFELKISVVSVVCTTELKLKTEV